MSYTVRPLSDRTWLRGAHRRQPTRFSSSWSETEKMLINEVGHLRGRNLVIEVDLQESDLKVDGTPKARARAASPGVVVAFETPQHGPMLYRCDTFTTSHYDQGPEWQHNVRAIAKTLEALRSVDRYGATETGQQYTGFKALPAGRAMPPSHMTTEAAYDVLCEVLGPEVVINGDYDDTALIRRARAAAHPDRNNGARTLWDRVEQAAVVLGVPR